MSCHSSHTLPIFVVDLFPTAGQPEPKNMLEVQTRATALQYQNRFWAEYGGSAGLAGFIAMLEELDQELPAKSPLRKRAAFEWLSRLRALKNIRIIASAAAPAGGDHDFSQYGVRKACEAGRSAVVKHFEHTLQQPAKLRTQRSRSGAQLRPCERRDVRTTAPYPLPAHRCATP